MSVKNSIFFVLDVTETDSLPSFNAKPIDLICMFLLISHASFVVRPRVILTAQFAHVDCKTCFETIFIGNPLEFLIS